MKHMFEPMSEKIQKKLAGWKGRLLSFGGKIILIKHVLASMPIHILSVLNLPKGIHNDLNRILSSFLWNATDGSKRRKWVSWRKFCYPIEEGGLGIRDFNEVQQALFMKFAWKLKERNSFWADFFRAKNLKKNFGGLGEDIPYTISILERGGFGTAYHAAKFILPCSRWVVKLLV